MDIEPLVNRIEIISETGFKADSQAVHQRIVKTQAYRSLVIDLINIPCCSKRFRISTAPHRTRLLPWHRIRRQRVPVVQPEPRARAGGRLLVGARRLRWSRSIPALGGTGVPDLGTRRQHQRPCTPRCWWSTAMTTDLPAGHARAASTMQATISRRSSCPARVHSTRRANVLPDLTGRSGRRDEPRTNLGGSRIELLTARPQPSRQPDRGTDADHPISCRTTS